MVKGTVFDVQRFSVHDGPGIRTTVFLKGCPLRCLWCHNPESQRLQPEVFFQPANCLDCRRCFSACPEQALDRDRPARVIRNRCTGCGECAAVCVTEALTMTGQEMMVEEVMDRIDRDAAFYATSGGGVTLSGGDPIAQVQFSVEILRRCQEKGYHTCVETSGQAPWSDLARILAHTDLVLYDIKAIDDRAHRRFTGVSNRRILDNARRAAELGKAMVLRVPVVPGCNDDPANLEATARFAASLPGCPAVELLPYHQMAESKYDRLGRVYSLKGLKPPSAESMEVLKALVAPRRKDD